MIRIPFYKSRNIILAVFALLALGARAQEANASLADSTCVRPSDALLCLDKSEAPYQTGKATYYSAKMHGRKMSSGKTYSKHGFTCAHRTLPFGTKVLVVNQRNGRKTVVEVADRGPFRKGVIIDLSNAAAAELEMLRAGVVPVELFIVPDSLARP